MNAQSSATEAVVRNHLQACLEQEAVDAVDRFELKSLRVQGNIAFITWSVGSEIPLGTDTFVVDNGKIVSQTFAMYAPPAR